MGVVKFRENFKTITTDNGSEFKDYNGIERSYTESGIARTSQYYCKRIALGKEEQMRI